MRGNNVVMNFAHTPGPCGAALTNDGFVLVTAGSDASVRSHDIRGKSEKNTEPWWIKNPGSEPELPEMAIGEIHETPINTISIAPDNNTLATGSDDGFVRIFSFGAEETSSDPKEGKLGLKADGDLIVACARFGGPVRALDFSPTGAFLAAAGEEPGVLKIIMTAQPSNVNILKCGEKEKGREATVDIAFDPKSDFVATVGELGSACIWSVESGNFVSVIALNDRLAKSVTWSPDGGALVIGTDKGGVIVNRGTWVFDHLLKDAADEDEDDDDVGLTELSKKTTISAVAWSSSGRYLLTGAGDARISVWDVDNRKILNSWKAEAAIQRLMWHPKDNAFVAVDEIGQFGIVSDVVPSHLPGPFDSSMRIELPQPAEVKMKKPKRKGDASDSDDEINIRRSKSAQLKKEKKNKKATRKAKDVYEAENSASDSDSSSGTRRTGEFQFAFDAEELEADDEEELKGDKNGYDSDTSDGERDDDEIVEERRKKRRARKRVKAFLQARAMALPTVQSPFMPSSTPLEERTTKKKRILCWNLTGAVLSFDETTHDVVEVEFADATRRSVGIKDHFGYSLGCLSSTGVLLGAPKTEAHGSLIYFRPFSSWSSNSDWTQFLQGEENVISLALGATFAAIGTTPNNTLRMFSLSGIQTDVFGIAGPIVTMAAYEDQLAIVYGVPGTKMLRYELLEISATSEITNVACTGDIVLSAGATLEWIGFSANTKELAVYDSSGTLYVLFDKLNARRWIPMIRNAASSADCDWLWVAAVNSDSVVGAPCHSNERFPPAKPRPALRSVPLSAPVVQPLAKNGKASIAERMFRSKLRVTRARNQKALVEEECDSDDEDIDDADEAVYKAEVEVDKCILALMEEACKHEQNLRAFDLASRLHTKVSFKYAVDLANYFKRTALATRVQDIARQKSAILEEEEREKLLKTNRAASASRKRKNSVNRGVAERSDMNSGSDNQDVMQASAQASGGVLEGVSDDDEALGKSGKSNGDVLGSKRPWPASDMNCSQKSVKGTAGSAPGPQSNTTPAKRRKGSFVNRFKK